MYLKTLNCESSFSLPLTSQSRRRSAICSICWIAPLFDIVIDFFCELCRNPVCVRVYVCVCVYSKRRRRPFILLQKRFTSLPVTGLRKLKNKTKKKKSHAKPFSSFSSPPPPAALCVSSELQATTLSCKTKNGTSACFQVVVSFCCVFFNEPRLRSLRPESLTTDRNRSQTLSPRRMTCTASPFIHFGLMFCELSPRSSLLLPFYLFIFRRQSILQFFYRDFFFCLCSFLWLLFLWKLSMFIILIWPGFGCGLSATSCPGACFFFFLMETYENLLPVHNCEIIWKP